MTVHGIYNGQYKLLLRDGGQRYAVFVFNTYKVKGALDKDMLEKVAKMLKVPADP
jgi:hypothetical protein